jgi:prolyl-tRNA editing enzyme YbaK/EbsC (Cys-tRNA(Pro) deacylase)
VLSCSDVHNFLAEQGIPHEIVHLPARSTTAARAASLLGVPAAEVVKSLLFLVDGVPVLVLVPGDRNADEDRVREVVGGSDCTLARPKQVLDITGFRVGAVPPCAQSTTTRVLADEQVFQPAVVYCGGGTETTMLKIRSDDLRTVVTPEIGDLTSAPQ